MQVSVKSSKPSSDGSEERPGYLHLGQWSLNLKNGHGGSALPLRGYKFQTYEGGMRVPCIMRWPGVIPEGATCSEIIASIDLLPTLAGLAKVDLPRDRVIDGVDVFSMMRGQRVVLPETIISIIVVVLEACEKAHGSFVWPRKWSSTIWAGSFRDHQPRRAGARTGSFHAGGNGGLR